MDFSRNDFNNLIHKLNLSESFELNIESKDENEKAFFIDIVINKKITIINYFKHINKTNYTFDLILVAFLYEYVVSLETNGNQLNFKFNPKNNIDRTKYLTKEFRENIKVFEYPNLYFYIYAMDDLINNKTFACVVKDRKVYRKFIIEYLREKGILESIFPLNWFAFSGLMRFMLSAEDYDPAPVFVFENNKLITIRREGVKINNKNK